MTTAERTTINTAGITREAAEKTLADCVLIHRKAMVTPGVSDFYAGWLAAMPGKTPGERVLAFALSCTLSPEEFERVSWALPIYQDLGAALDYLIDALSRRMETDAADIVALISEIGGLEVVSMLGRSRVAQRKSEVMSARAKASWARRKAAKEVAANEA